MHITPLTSVPFVTLGHTNKKSSYEGAVADSMKVTVMTKASTWLSVEPLAFMFLIFNEKLRASAILADMEYCSDVPNLSRGL